MSAPSGPLDWTSAPPDGYRVRDSPAPLPLHLRALVALWVPFSLLATVSLVIGIHGFVGTIELFSTFVPEEFAAWVLYASWILSLVVLLVIIHELLHALTAVLLGYDVAFQVHANTRMDWEVSVVTYGKFQTRLDTVLIALTPLVVITPVGVVVLALGSQGAALAAGFLLAVNAMGAVLDVRTVLLMLSLPSGALVRHTGDGSRRYYAPEN